ncbi:7TMR-DISM extracellular protein 2 [Lutibacter sp. Hel_I_33_5]|uniref:7TM diverse intracellular signaling domain-containing protein n=1 Tax=Lutibacter sp. Hel_I_33_5 TaxID=1566289 RepID=UPI0011A25109|nr:7TM diverse intracellular signaling domain-containing protein [Lutibacter sp. Hel_I_33_5]TVZ56165.1 7TMR-DISM extracellular protein 2 [Lutibacter sp. Hel_I_33_5]
MRKILLIIIFFSLKSFAFQDTLFVSTENTNVNLTKSTSFFTSEEDILLEDFAEIDFITNKSSKDFFYFDFNQKTILLKFIIKNISKKENTYFLRFSNALIYEIELYKKDNLGLNIVDSTGIKYPFLKRKEKNRNFVIPIQMKEKEASTFLIKFNKAKGRPLVTNIILLDDNSYNNTSFKEYILIGVYVGLSLICVLISICLLIVLKDKMYLFYALYVLFLGLFIVSYSGVFQQVILDGHAVLNKYKHYVVFSEIALILFVLFSQHFLDAKKYQPKLYKTLLWVLGVAVFLRILLHFFFNELFAGFIPIFMKIWYTIHLFGTIIIAYQIITIYKKNKLKHGLFAFAYLSMILGAVISVLYHSGGFVNGMINNLPILLYSSFIEIVLITIALVLMVKNIIYEKEQLVDSVIKEKQKNLTDAIVLNNKSKVYLNSLKYIKSDGNYIEFHIEEKKIVDRNKLKTLQETLPSNFVRIHKSYIINKNYIKTTNSNSIILHTDIVIPLSRHYKKNL